MMEDSHFNSSYFWSHLPTVPTQLENSMFLNKVKEHQEKNASFSPSSASHYQTTLLTIPTPGAKTDGGGQAGGAAHLHPPHSTQNITVLPVPSTGIMTAAGLVITTPQGTLVSPTSSQSFVSGHPATTMIVSALPSSDKKEGDGTSHVVVMPSPSKRGRKKKVTTLSRVATLGGPGHDTLILTHLTPGGHVSSLQHHHPGDPYEMSHEDEEHGHKDSTKTYRNHTESKPHKCPHCTKSFANSSYLAQHIRIHTGVKPYSCSYCDKCFRQLSHLQQHSRIHTGDRPYKCTHPGCEKSFTQLSNLQSHRRQHNKDKPYKCPNCNKGYIDAASLEVHMSTHTVKHAKIYSCGLCNRSYTSVRQMSISEEHFYMKHYETPHWHQTPGSYFTPCSHVSTVSPLPILPSSQETYLVKHMEKHNPDQLTASVVSAAQAAQQSQSQAQGQAGAQGRVESTDGGSRRPGGAGGGAAGGGQQSQNSYPQTETMPCPFDLHQYKTVSAGDIQYKPVSVSDITSHKDLCLTVSASTIQVEHLNS
ncbi:PREDICTED: zinc finger protein 384 isoform X4 [Poecilia mexicana]|uniref:zinc finger protein 384 isoform X4 n=1 Tax=Poecilia mexicana TaxID=48701 RepID=UPI00072EAA06|nr:PREDICTED: zinc finger protein 384 isoform X4 [Poecilia mexicana]XP_016526028.1 PREDICTED: zinc finger protein 384 isoform X4 [Poecilia formosa]